MVETISWVDLHQCPDVNLSQSKHCSCDCLLIPLQHNTYWFINYILCYSRSYVGEPPSSVLNVTVTEKDRNTLQINWQEPDITNGNITGYVVTVTVYGEYGNFSQVNTTIVSNVLIFSSLCYDYQ